MGDNHLHGVGGCSWESKIIPAHCAVGDEGLGERGGQMQQPRQLSHVVVAMVTASETSLLVLLYYDLLLNLTV